MIPSQVIAIVTDNASNNNTLMTSLEQRCEERGIPFSARNARMRCMPHTIHLAAIKLLEGIGAISKGDGKKAAAHGGNYQDNITTPLAREHDDNATANDGPEGDGTVMDLVDTGTELEAASGDHGVLSGIEKVVDNFQFPTSANQGYVNSFGRLSKVSALALNAVSRGLVRLCSSKEVGVPMTVVPH